MKMRSFFHISFFSIVFSAFYGCNSDVFINDYSPSANEVRLSEDDSVSVISFGASNWKLFQVYSLENDCFTEITGDIYGKDGNLIAGNSSIGATGLDNQAVKMVVSDFDLSLTIERKDDTHLVLSNPENIDDKTKRIYLELGNEYVGKTISVDIEPSSSKYVLDSIVYSLNHYYLKDSMKYEDKAFGFINGTYKVSEFDIRPYKEFMIDYSFVNEHEFETVLTEEQLKIFGNDAPIVPVPTKKYGLFEMNGLTMPLTAAVQEAVVPDKMLEIKENVSLNPRTQRNVILRCWYCYYGFEYKIYASHKKTGKRRILKGMLDIYYPQSYSVMLGKEIGLEG